MRMPSILNNGPITQHDMTSSTDMPPWASKSASQLLLTLCARGESQQTEFKQMLPDQGHAIGRSLAAFATSNAGYLVYGVTDDGTLVGLPDAESSSGRDKIAQRIAGAAKQVRPPVHFELKWAVHHGLTACLIEIEKGFEAVYYSNERPMVRRLTITRPAEPGEVEQWAAAGIPDTDLSSSSLFELYWTDIADCRVAPSRVVEPLDVVEHIGPRFFARPVDLARDALGLHRAEEALHR